MTQSPNSLAALEAHRAATQFGGERANPQAQDLGIKRNSVRNSIRYMAGQAFELPEDYEKLTMHALAKLLLPPKPSLSQIGASLRLATMLLKGADDGIIEQIDGKLPQVNVNAEFAELLGMTPDELRTIGYGTDSQSDAGRRNETGSLSDSVSEAPAAAGQTEGKTWIAPAS